MARNTPLDPPPVQSPIIGLKNLVSDPWIKWFTRLRLLNSNVNHQSITVATTVNLDSEWVTLDGTSGAYAITLNAPTLAGIDKSIEMTVYTSHSVTMSLSNCTGGTASTTCTWNGVGQILHLKSTAGGKWNIIKQSNVTLT